MTQHTLTLIVALLLLASVAVPIAAAQENGAAGNSPTAQNQSGQQNATAPPGAPNELELVVDETVAVVDHRYADGELTIDFYASQTSAIAVSPAAPSDQEVGTISGESYILEGSKTTSITIASPGGATFWSTESITDTTFYYIRKPSNSLIAGPYDGGDVATGSIAGALGVATAVIYGAVVARLGGRDGGRKVA